MNIINNINRFDTNRIYRRSKQSGQVIMGSVLLFLTIAITVLVGIATPVAIQVRSAADFLQSRQAYISADVLNEEALYRLNKGKTLPSNLVLSFNGATSTALISFVGAEEQVLATGISGAFTRLSQSLFTQGQGNFGLNYAAQVGTGGITMSGSPTINGDVMSNGDISGSGVSTINGNVTSASLITQTVDASYGPNPTPGANALFGYGYAFGNTTASFAQSFTVSTSSPLSRIALFIYKSNAMPSANVYIATDSGGSPSSTYLLSGTLNASQVTSNYAWVPVVFTSKVSLTPGTTYWIVVDVPSNNIGGYYGIGLDYNGVYQGYNNYHGYSKIGQFRNAWNPFSFLYPQAPSYFQTFLGGASTVGGIVVNGNVNGYIVNNSTVSGTLYCQSGTGNNKSCNTSSSTPSAMTYPFSNTNITNWETEATNGGVYNGNLTIGGVTATSTGPLKINGNLWVTSSGRLTIKGTIYVTGNVTVDGAAVVSLDTSYGTKSGVIVTDGVITNSGSGLITGNGTTGSYITAITTNGCGGTSTTCTSSPAVNLSGNASSLLIFAPNGRVDFSGSASAKSLIAYKLNLSGNVTVNYDSTLSSLSYNNASGGGSTSWITDTWKEISN